MATGVWQLSVWNEVSHPAKDPCMRSSRSQMILYHDFSISSRPRSLLTTLSLAKYQSLIRVQGCFQPIGVQQTSKGMWTFQWLQCLWRVDMQSEEMIQCPMKQQTSHLEMHRGRYVNRKSQCSALPVSCCKSACRSLYNFQLTVGPSIPIWTMLCLRSFVKHSSTLTIKSAAVASPINIDVKYRVCTLGLSEKRLWTSSCLRWALLFSASSNSSTYCLSFTLSASSCWKSGARP